MINTNMKIALIDPSGFSMLYDHCLADALAQQGCQVVLVASKGPFQQNDSDRDYAIWDWFYKFSSNLKNTKVRVYLKGAEHSFGMARLCWSLWQYRPDVIHFQWIPAPFVDALFLRFLRRLAPLVLTVHDTEPYHGWPSTRLQLLGLISAYKLFDQYIVHTQFSKEALLKQMRVSEDRISVVPHGVYSYYRDFLKSGPSTPTLLGIEGKKKVLCLGMLKPYKGIDVLLEAFSRLPESLLKGSVLQIVGLPKMPVEPLKVLAKKLGIEDKVLWDLRFVEEREVAGYFSQADVVVLPYRRIDQSGVLMVALAFGKPVVASRVGGFAETIKDGVHGFLVEPGNPDDLARALARLLQDENLRVRMGKEVEKLATGEFSWESVAKKTIEAYQQLIQKRKVQCSQ